MGTKLKYGERNDWRQSFLNNMEYLLKIPQKEFELLCIKTLTDDCVVCDMTKCHKTECFFKIKLLRKYVTPRYVGVKHWIYYFLYHPELHWSKPPLLPRKGYWCIHHKDNNHWNDEEENLQLITVSDHMKLHIKRGEHNWVGDKNHKRHTDRYVSMLKFLSEIDASIKMTLSIAISLKYSSLGNMLRTIKKLIKTDFPELELLSINRNHYVSRKRSIPGK